MKILVVDDFAVMRGVICHVLDEIGYSNTEEAVDGAHALKLLRSAKYDFVVSDWNMPNLNGQQLLECIRKDELLKHIPVLMVTAETEKSVVMEAIKAGVNAFIVKPFTPDALQQKLKIIFPD